MLCHEFAATAYHAGTLRSEYHLRQHCELGVQALQVLSKTNELELLEACTGSSRAR